MLSRGAMLGIIASLLFLIVLYRKEIFAPKVKLPLLIVTLTALLVATLTIYQYLPVVTEKVYSYISFELKESTIGIRVMIGRGAWNMIKARPFQGWGIGTFPIVYPGFRLPEYFLNPCAVNATAHAHNELLETWSELGIIGLGLFLGLVVSIFVRGIKTFYSCENGLPKATLAAAMAGIVAMLTMNLTCVNLRFSASGIMLYFFLGLAALTSRFARLSAPTNPESEAKTPFYRLKVTIPKIITVIIIVGLAVGLGWVYKIHSVDTIRSSSYLKKGILARGKKDWTEAIEWYKKSVEYNPTSLRAYYRLAYAYAHTPETDKALVAYKQLEKFAPNYAQLHYNVAAIYLKKSNWKEAGKELEKSIALNPYDSRTHSNLGTAYKYQGKLPEAVEAYKKAIDLDAGSYVAYIGLGDIVYSNKQWKDAAFCYAKAIQYGVKNDRILVRLGECFFRMKKFDEAKRAYSAALKLNPSSDRILVRLGNCYLLKEELDKAKELYEAALKINPSLDKVKALVSEIEKRLKK